MMKKIEQSVFERVMEELRPEIRGADRGTRGSQEPTPPRHDRSLQGQNAELRVPPGSRTSVPSPTPTPPTEPGNQVDQPQLPRASNPQPQHETIDLGIQPPPLERQGSEPARPPYREPPARQPNKIRWLLSRPSEIYGRLRELNAGTLVEVFDRRQLRPQHDIAARVDVLRRPISHQPDPQHSSAPLPPGLPATLSAQERQGEAQPQGDVRS